MARDVHERWDDEEPLFSDSSDGSPRLSYRHDKYRRYASCAEGKSEDGERRRSPVTVLAKFFLFCSAMILFCVLLYIPVYNRANDQVPKAAVAGWSIHTNRDTKIYVQPDNVTSIHEPRDVCPKATRNKKNNLFLLIVVCSSTVNFDQRNAIRETWGNYSSYVELSKVFNEVTEKYKTYNYTYDLYVDEDAKSIVNISLERGKRDISSIGQLLPELAKALQDNIVHEKPDVEEKRFDDEDDKMLPEFDMNKEIGDQDDDVNFDYDYGSNIMKIPPKGYEDSPDLWKVLTMLKHSKSFPKDEFLEATDPDFKVVFLLGLPSQINDTEVQDKIDEESEKYGDVIQEGFIDSYNNLTLKSIMMLKWVTNNCNESVRYVLKTDDDMYVNVPNLVSNLRNRSKHHDAEVTRGGKKNEYLLIGDLICGARPVQDASNKWYSPRYMYRGRVYPRYLSGTGYVLSADTARALYAAALTTNYFHLEDIYITGICAVRAHPRITPRDEPGFSYAPAKRTACGVHARLTAHRVPPRDMRRLHAALRRARALDRCERIRLTQVRKDRLRPKTPPKRNGKLNPTVAK